MKSMNAGASLTMGAAVTMTVDRTQRSYMELDARISGAEDMTGTARIRSGEACIRGDQAPNVTVEAQRSASDSNKRASQMPEKK